MNTPTSDSPTMPKSVHFLAFLHGMWGKPRHLATADETIRDKMRDVKGETELSTWVLETNADTFTFDGVDWCAERAVKEIYDTVEKLEKDGVKKVVKFSIVGYSLGGLIARYAIGILYQRGFFQNVAPVNFTTFATPHIGLPRFSGFVRTTIHKLGPVMLSRTGRQFFCVDDDVWSSDAKERKPLLEVMSEKDSVFFKALASFPNMTIYGNAVHDLTVVYSTSLIESHDPFAAATNSKSPRLIIKMDPKYRHVIQSYHEASEGEEVPLHEFEIERRAQRDAIPWYFPSRYRIGRPWTPPPLQFRFPLNLVFYLLSPFFIPLVLTYAVTRLRRESRSSRIRLAELEKSLEAESTLAAMLRRMENAVADAVDSGDPGAIDGSERQRSGEGALEEGIKVPGDEGQEMRKRKASRPGTPETGASSPPTPVPTPRPALQAYNESNTQSNHADDPLQPLLTPAQLRMIESLNSIPQLRKVAVYFPYVRNAHGVIIVRDPGMFPVNNDGRSVLRHWADRFVL